MIVGICGFIGCGKDTVADYLINQHEFKKESFASSLKDAVSAIFGWDREMLEGRSKEARLKREEIDTWWADKLNMPTLSPRWVLQYWGTEVARRTFHDDIWIRSLEKKLLVSETNVVIADCRFPNEVASIRQAGGHLIWVQRGQHPEWIDAARAASNGEVWGLNKMNELQVHSSEWSWLSTDFDFVIKNNGDLPHLYKQIEDFLEVGD